MLSSNAANVGNTLKVYKYNLAHITIDYSRMNCLFLFTILLIAAVAAQEQPTTWNKFMSFFGRASPNAADAKNADDVAKGLLPQAGVQQTMPNTAPLKAAAEAAQTGASPSVMKEGAENVAEGAAKGAKRWSKTKAGLVVGAVAALAGTVAVVKNEVDKTEHQNKVRAGLNPRFRN